MKVERYLHTATLLSNDTVLAVGGYSGQNALFAEFYVP
jgi:hypothetical protein